jgi:hypothetical protein
MIGRRYRLLLLLVADEVSHEQVSADGNPPTRCSKLHRAHRGSSCLSNPRVKHERQTKTASPGTARGAAAKASVRAGSAWRKCCGTTRCTASAAAH